jgi:serine/threonine protein kinase
VFHQQVEPLPLDLHHCCPFQDSFSVLLTSEISRNEGTVVHDGVITIGTKKGPATRPIIMKSGFNEDKRLIEAEYRIYQLLDRECVPASHVYGLFRDRDPDGATAILMGYAGTQIDQFPSGLSPAQQCVHSLSIVLFPYFVCRLSFCELLQRIHRAGILHNDIAKRNLLVTGTGEAVIIDFGNATVVDRNEQEAFDDEMSQLRSILYDRESISCTQVVV